MTSDQKFVYLEDDIYRQIPTGARFCEYTGDSIAHQIQWQQKLEQETINDEISE